LLQFHSVWQVDFELGGVLRVMKQWW